jgi:hypothetical protein
LEPFIDWVTVISTLVMTGATLALAYYAFVTIREGKKDRRKDTIEKMLENLYSPLYGILRRAKFGNGERSDARQSHGFEWVIDESELAQILEMTQTYGHYLDRNELAKVLLTLEKPMKWREIKPPSTIPPTTPYGTVTYYGFTEIDMSEHFDTIKSTRDKLMKELDDLTKV